MARHLIQNAATGETRIVGDAALPFFPGFAIVDTYDDGIPPAVFYGAGEADLRYVNVTELSDPTSAASVILRAASVAAVEDADDVAPTGSWDFTNTPTVGGQPLSDQAALDALTASQAHRVLGVGPYVGIAPDRPTVAGAFVLWNGGDDPGVKASDGDLGVGW